MRTESSFCSMTGMPLHWGEIPPKASDYYENGSEETCVRGTNNAYSILPEDKRPHL